MRVSHRASSPRRKQGSALQGSGGGCPPRIGGMALFDIGPQAEFSLLPLLLLLLSTPRCFHDDFSWLLPKKRFSENPTSLQVGNCVAILECLIGWLIVNCHRCETCNEEEGRVEGRWGRSLD